MKRDIQTLRSFEAIKILADARRLEILRLLMGPPATITQLGVRMRRSPAWIRHHINVLQRAGLVRLDEVRVSGRATEKYYGAEAGALVLEQMVLPKTRLPVIIFSGSHDPALDATVDALAATRVFLKTYVGSLNGLTNLRRGFCQVTGIHLLDQGGEYNRPYVKHFFADRDVELITLAHRTQGLMLASGNPKSIRHMRDLDRPGVRFVNRNAGSGTRLRIDGELATAGVDCSKVRGMDVEVSTHSQAARWIRNGKADVAVGLQASARESGLDFVPLFEERYDLVLARASEGALEPVLDALQTGAFRRRAQAMAGYDTTHSGEVIRL